MPVVHSSANVFSTEGVLSGHGPSSNVSTTSFSRRKSSCLKCSKPIQVRPWCRFQRRAQSQGMGFAQGALAGAGVAAGSGAGAAAAGAVMLLVAGVWTTPRPCAQRNRACKDQTCRNTHLAVPLPDRPPSPTTVGQAIFRPQVIIASHSPARPRQRLCTSRWICRFSQVDFRGLGASFDALRQESEPAQPRSLPVYPVARPFREKPPRYSRRGQSSICGSSSAGCRSAAHLAAHL